MLKIKLTGEELALLRKYVPSAKDGIKPEGDDTFTIEDSGYEVIMLDLDDAIIDAGMIDQDILNDTGRALQRLYDNLYNQINQN